MGKKIVDAFKLVIKGILEVIYPSDNNCKGCGKRDIEGLCSECVRKINPCNEEELCIGYYGHVLKKLILEFKYKKDFEAGEILVELIKNKLNKLNNEYILTFIPVAKGTLKERGFNQCEYIARELGFKLDMKVENTLIKVKDTKIQKTLRREERLKNIKGAFQVIDDKVINGKKFILIDDVITTGATMSEGKRILLENGAKEIKILTLAKSHI